MLRLFLIQNFRFEDREHLRKHMHNVHIKSRHLVCRYEGCTMAYDDSGSRSNHERIKHGHPYPRAAKMGLVPPIVRKKSPFLLPIPTVPPSATAND